jgi:hypothetical protein
MEVSDLQGAISHVFCAAFSDRWNLAATAGPRRTVRTGSMGGRAAGDGRDDCGGTAVPDTNGEVE